MKMEYVEKLTLKEAIEEGETEVDAWRHMVSLFLVVLLRNLKSRVSNFWFPVPNPIRYASFYVTKVRL